MNTRSFEYILRKYQTPASRNTNIEIADDFLP